MKDINTTTSMKLEVTEKTQEKIRKAYGCSPHCSGFDQMTRIIIRLDLGLQITKNIIDSYQEFIDWLHFGNSNIHPHSDENDKECYWNMDTDEYYYHIKDVYDFWASKVKKL